MLDVKLMVKPNTPRRHHYLPEFYLANFSSKNKLAVFRRELGRHHRKYDTVSPSGIGYVKDFYRFIDPDGGYNYGIETELFGEVDNAAKLVIEKLIAGDPLTEDERVSFANFAAFQYLRGTAYKHTYDSIAEKASKELIKFRNSVLESRAKKTNLKYEKLTTDFELVVPRQDSLKAMLDSAMDIVNIILGFDWYFIRPHGNYGFITTDNPFVMLPLEKLPPMSGVGFLTNNTLKILPLSTKLCFAMRNQGEGGKIAYLSHQNNTIRSINGNLALLAREFILGCDMRLVKSIARKTRIDK